MSTKTLSDLLDALKFMDEILIAYDIDKEAVCDHSVGICWCEYLRKRELIKEVIAKAGMK